MNLDHATDKARTIAVYTMPPVLGFTIDISAGMLMTILTCLAAFIGQLVYQISSSKARSHKDWVEADNASLRPQLDSAKEERDQLRLRVGRLELESADSIRAERDLALAILEQNGTFAPGQVRP